MKQEPVAIGDLPRTHAHYHPFAAALLCLMMFGPHLQVGSNAAQSRGYLT